MAAKRSIRDGTTGTPLTREHSLRIIDFLGLVDAGVRRHLGRRYTAFSMRQRFGYVQYWRGEHWLHYEVWVQRKTQRLEIGLHFEGERERSYAAAARLGEAAADIAAAIGPEYELEEWTASWTRLHRTFSAPSLTAELAEEAGLRTADLIRGMEPIVERLGLR